MKRPQKSRIPTAAPRTDSESRLVNALVITLGVLAILTMIGFALVAWLVENYG